MSPHDTHESNHWKKNKSLTLPSPNILNTLLVPLMNYDLYSIDLWSIRLTSPYMEILYHYRDEITSSTIERGIENPRGPWQKDGPAPHAWNPKTCHWQSKGELWDGKLVVVSSFSLSKLPFLVLPYFQTQTHMLSHVIARMATNMSIFLLKGPNNGERVVNNIFVIGNYQSREQCKHMEYKPPASDDLWVPIVVTSIKTWSI